LVKEGHSHGSEESLRTITETYSRGLAHLIEKLKKIANDIPFHSMSVEGTKTVALPKKAE
jgi:hypothetical protein